VENSRKFADRPTENFCLKNRSFFQTACGRPQGGGVRLMWTHVDRGRGKKPDLRVGVISTLIENIDY